MHYPFNRTASDGVNESIKKRGQNRWIRFVGGTDHPILVEKAVQTFAGYIERCAALIPNYGERWRNGERITTAFVESSVNVVAGKRFCKKQQMQRPRPKEHICSCKRGRRYSTTNWRTDSGSGIRPSANHRLKKSG